MKIFSLNATLALSNRRKEEKT